MLRGPLGQNEYKPKFSGHDTFPFRYAWLTKFIHYVEDGNLKKIALAHCELDSATEFKAKLEQKQLGPVIIPAPGEEMLMQ